MITDTAVAHARAWKETFDPTLERLGVGPAFTVDEDYRAHVDGRSRLDGVRAFLASRGVELPDGGPGDEPDALTVHAVGTRKNERVQEIIETDGVRAYPDAVALIGTARASGVPCALVSSSANARAALRSVGLDDCFDAWVDGERIVRDAIPGKPAPDAFLTAARDLGVDPAQATVLEDAPAGVAAGRAGGFGCVIGVDRTGARGAELRDHGASIVLTDLTRLDLGDG